MLGDDVGEAAGIADLPRGRRPSLRHACFLLRRLTLEPIDSFTDEFGYRRDRPFVSVCNFRLKRARSPMKRQITTRRSACIRFSWSCHRGSVQPRATWRARQLRRHRQILTPRRVVRLSDRHHFPVSLERLVESMLGLLAGYKEREGHRRQGTKSFLGIAGQIAVRLGLAARARDVPGKLFGTLERL
jgi:hypothetical protein